MGGAVDSYAKVEGYAAYEDGCKARINREEILRVSGLCKDGKPYHDDGLWTAKKEDRQRRTTGPKATCKWSITYIARTALKFVGACKIMMTQARFIEKMALQRSSQVF